MAGLAFEDLPCERLASLDNLWRQLDAEFAKIVNYAGQALLLSDVAAAKRGLNVAVIFATKSLRPSPRLATLEAVPWK